MHIVHNTEEQKKNMKNATLLIDETFISTGKMVENTNNKAPTTAIHIYCCVYF